MGEAAEQTTKDEWDNLLEPGQRQRAAALMVAGGLRRSRSLGGGAGYDASELLRMAQWISDGSDGAEPTEADVDVATEAVRMIDAYLEEMDGLSMTDAERVAQAAREIRGVLTRE